MRDYLKNVVRGVTIQRRPRSGSRAKLIFLGEACFGGVAAVCDASEGIFDREVVERIGIVVARPFLGMDMAWMGTLCDRFEQLVEARDATAIL